MRNFSLSRTGARANWARRSILAWGPLGAALACNVYDDSLTGVMTPLGGSGSSAAAGSDSGGKSSDGGKMSDGGGGSKSSTSGSGGDEVSGGGGSGGSAAGTTAAGGGTGGTSTAGTGGTGGSANGGGGSGGTAPSDVELIDDMEDGDAAIFPNHGRNGYWYTGGDLTPSAVLTPPANKFAMTMLAVGDRSDYAASVKAENFADWGSVMGFNFVEKNGPQPYDASAFCGVHFWGKAAAPVTLRLRVPDVNTHPAGGVCKDPGASGTSCYDHFGSAVAFGKVWAEYSFKFADLTQIGSGYHPPTNKLSTDKLYAMEWALPGGAPKTYQIWVDDVELLKCP